MLEKPDLPDEQIIGCLQDAYSVDTMQISFLPLGNDHNTGVYRVLAANSNTYFVKLRRGAFDETSVALQDWLSSQGIANIIPIVATTAGQLWAQLGAFTMIVYPFINGQDGYTVAMSDQHWRDFGIALRRMHTADVPRTLTQRIQQETYSAQGRLAVLAFLEYPADAQYADSVAQQLVAFLHAKRSAILELVTRTERLAQILQQQQSTYVVCHSDIHAGNLLIDPSGHLYIVDWDNPILAPKERDLMFVGGGQGFIGHTLEEEQLLFYQGYGHVEIDQVAIAYYRYERIIQDIAVYCEQLLLTSEGGEDRSQNVRYLMSNFLPGNTIAVAYAADQSRLPPEEAGVR